jgi:CBS domain-containing protein
MTPSRKPLFELTARDLMTPAVMVLPADMRLPAAARLLGRLQVSGAPVVDATGRCVGVLSAADFMRWAEGDTPRCTCLAADLLGLEWEVVELEEMPDDVVAARMTPDPVMVSPDAPLAAVARMMFEAHIHRLIVTDTDGRPAGVVTTTDILAALVGAAEEETHERHEDRTTPSRPGPVFGDCGRPDDPRPGVGERAGRGA